MIDSELCKFGDVNHSITTGQDFDERAKVFGADDFAFVNRVEFDLLELAGDHLDRTVERLFFRCIDMHGAVVLDIDLGTRLCLDAFDVLASWADELADPVGIDLHCFDSRRVFAEWFWSRNDIVHDLKDIGPCFACNFDGFLKDGEGESREFEVKLVASHSFFRSTEFKVHVAEEVF